jgi:hypothetical protein
MTFEKELKALAYTFCPVPKVKVGDTVLTRLKTNKKLTPVKITEVGYTIVINQNRRARRDKESIEQYRHRVETLLVELYYYGKIIKSQRTLFLDNFISQDSSYGWASTNENINVGALFFPLKRKKSSRFI